MLAFCIPIRKVGEAMSAVCGIVCGSSKEDIRDMGSVMMSQLGVYHADAVGIWQEEMVFLGCHTQHITPESVKETLPFFEEAADLSITADAIIDNRQELFKHLGIERSLWDCSPDSVLILKAYQKWGRNCPKYLLGDFAFAIWDKKRKELFCAVDHTGKRTLYYSFSSDFFVFASLIRPLTALPGIGKTYNETWMADFLAVPVILHQLDGELTPYHGVHLLRAGHSLTVGPGSLVKKVYWQVERQPQLILNSDREYEEAFLQVFQKAVSCRLRCIRPAGVMMSGGLDSTSVACMAARELAERGQRLQAFSAVPMHGYRNWLADPYLADETPYIEAVRQYAGNIDVTYCRSEGKHGLSDTDRLFAILEQPYKFIENLFWMDSILASARERGIRIMLTGQAGNLSISWGEVVPMLLSLLRDGQYLHLLRETWSAAKSSRRPYHSLLKLLSELLPVTVQKFIYQRAELDWFKGLCSLSPVNPDFVPRSVLIDRSAKYGFELSSIERLDSFEVRKQFFQSNFRSHSGIFATKMSLAHCMAIRDPSMDKRVIEFCLSVPDSQWVRNGKTRLLLRRAMAGILPDRVRLEENYRGIQSADWSQRLQGEWPKLFAEIETIGALEKEKEYLDIARIKAELSKYSVVKDDAVRDNTFRMLIRSLIFSRFLRSDSVITRG